MDKDQYKKLLDTLPEMAKVVNAFNSESVQEKAFDLMLKALGEKPEKVQAEMQKSNGISETNGGITGKTRKTARSKPPKLLPNLDLTKTNDIPSLRDFYSQFKSKTNLERNLIFVYYLKEKRKIDKVTSDHVYTCYRNIPDLKIPQQIKQSLIDTKNRKGWLNTSSLDDIQLEIAGTNHLEHDLEKTAEDADE